MNDDTSVSFCAQRKALIGFNNKKAISLSACLFFSALFVYAIFSSPTPDNPAMPEFIVGACLILSIPLISIFYVFIRRWCGFYSDLESSANWGLWLSFTRFLFITGLIIPSFIGIYQGHSLQNILRDIVAWGYLFLPLLFAPLFLQMSAQSINAQKILPLFLIVIGLVFALRVLLPAYGGDQALYLQFSFQTQDPFYLVNAPTVLFAAVFLAGVAGKRIFQFFTIKRLLISLIFVFIAIIPIMAMASIMQRASIGYIFLSLLFLILIAFILRPARALPLFLIGALCVYALSDMIGLVTEQLMQKTELVGLNMRFQEASAVIDHVGALGVAHILFGGGWGESFISPAVGELRVNFTHNLFTTMFLKMGLIGLVGAIFYLFPLCLMLINIVRRNPVMGVALAGPFLINVFLYASFKSFDFGLILLMIVLWGTRDCSVHLLEKPFYRRV